MFMGNIASVAAVVLDEHNIEYEILQRMSDGEHSLSRRAFNTLEYLKCRPFEQRLWRKVDACAVPSDREAGLIRKKAPATPTAVVPNAVDPDYFTPSSAPPERDTLIFTGLLSYRPNLDAATYLVNEILPLIQRERPGVTLTIVGDGHAVDMAKLKRPNVTVTGRVDDVRPYMHRAAVSVVPIRIGGGTRLKVVEALAMGKAVVSSQVGSEGIRVRDGEHLLLAGDDAVAFATRVLQLLSDPVWAAALGRAGRSLVAAEYTWRQATTRLETLYHQAMRRRDLRAGRPIAGSTAIAPSGGMGRTDRGSSPT
jgi:glycosyltransferase involved in cell wall biosynthesis